MPNTAVAKDAGGLHLSDGWNYAADFAVPYRLWLSVPLILGVVWLRVRSHDDRRTRIATVAMLAAAGLGAAYIVAIGGDYMHGRLLLPAFFALGLPASLAVRDRALPGAALCSLAAVVALVSVAWFRPPPPPRNPGFLPADVADWRTLSGARMVPEEFALGLNGTQARALYEQGVRGYFRADSARRLPGADSDEFVVILGAIGVAGYKAGTDVWIVDLSGLAEPIAARAPVLPGRPAGHRKLTVIAWYDARFGAESDDPDVAAASRALECEPIEELLEAINEPMTVGRFFSNMWHSVSYTRLTIPVDPQRAEALLCRSP